LETKNKELNWKRNVTLYLFGQGVSLIGTGLVSFAIMWYVTLDTNSGVVLTLYTAAISLPAVFITPFAGVWADRFSRKALINIADGSIAVVTLGIAFLFSQGMASIGALLACSVIRSLGQGTQMPAESAVIPQIVPEHALMRVNGINSSIQSFSMLASPLMAAGLLSVAPIQVILYIDVVTAAVGIGILVFFVKVPRLEGVASSQGKQAGGYRREILAGLSYIRAHGYVKHIFLFAAAFFVFLTPAAMLTPLQVIRDFGDEYWKLMAIEVVFSAGMLLGGILISVWGGFKSKSLTAAVGAAFVGLTGVGLGITGHFFVYLSVMAVMGIAVPLINAPIQTILQARVDEAYMGRVFSVMTIISGTVMPLSMIAFGPLADLIAIDYLLIAAGVGTVFLGAGFLLDKVVRQAGQ
jgi:DHA3 family macrolide efflux protein-like MFS transporter